MKKFLVLHLLLFMLLLTSCSKKEDDIIVDVLPTLKTLAVSNLTTNSATLGGQITSTGNVAISQRGIVWSTTPNVTLGSDSFASESTDDSFSTTINSLNANTTYYVKAYVQTLLGQRYGNEISFQTSNNTKAVVTTGEITFDQINSLLVNAEIVSSNSPVRYRGICFSTSPNPVPSINEGTGVGTFQKRIFTAPGTTYYIRAFAENAAGIAYGNEKIYTTISTIFSNSPNISDVDGNSIPTFTINNQRWTKKNLNVSKFKNGDPIPEVQNAAAWLSTTSPAWCYYQNNTENGPIYGKLYNHYAVEDPRGLAPAGWHIPSVVEFKNMLYYMGAVSQNVPLDQTIYFSNNSGDFRVTGIDYWLFPNANATNRSGFSSLPGGGRNYYAGSNTNESSFYFNNNTLASYWLSDVLTTNFENTPNLARGFTIGLSNDINSVSGVGFADRKTGFYIRCVKD